MKIEKGIPMPKKKSFRKYAWLDEMEIGDSVLVNTVKEVDIIRAQIRNQGKRSDFFIFIFRAISQVGRKTYLI